jgi:hypothetical protein
VADDETDRLPRKAASRKPKGEEADCQSAAGYQPAPQNFFAGCDEFDGL